MNSVINIKAKLPNGTVRDFRFAVPHQRPSVLEYQGPDGIARICEGHDLFQALVQVRQEFEQEGYRLLCVGSRRDVTPSRMSRSMSGGRKAYIVRRGYPLRRLISLTYSIMPNPKLLVRLRNSKRTLERGLIQLRFGSETGGPVSNNVIGGGNPLIPRLPGTGEDEVRRLSSADRSKAAGSSDWAPSKTCQG